MPDYIVTLFDGKNELPFLGLSPGKRVDLSEYNCRHIYPQDWQFFENLLGVVAFDPTFTYFLHKGYEIRLYRRKNK